MSKKNTLLYLDEDLVRKAKKNRINLSVVAENAILEELDMRNIEILFDPEEYLKTRRQYYIPHKMKNIVFKNIGPIEKFTMKLGSFNIAVGPNASGKSFLLRTLDTIVNKYEFEGKDIVSMKSKTGRVDIDFADLADSVRCDIKKESMNFEGGCLLVDDAFERLDEEYVDDFLEYLMELGPQLILMTQWLPKIKMKGVNVIEMPIKEDNDNNKVHGVNETKTKKQE